MAKVVYFTTLAGARAALRGMERSARRGRPAPRRAPCGSGIDNKRRQCSDEKAHHQGGI